MSEEAQVDEAGAATGATGAFAKPDETIADDSAVVETAAEPTEELAPEGEVPTEVQASEGAEEGTTESQAEAEPQDAVPQSVEDYKLPEGVPPQVAQFALEQGFTQTQLEATLQQFMMVTNANQEAVNTAMRDAGERYVADQWGEKADEELQKVRHTLRAVDRTGNMRQLLDASGYGNHPVVLEFFNNLGNTLREGGFVRGHMQSNNQQKSAAQALFGSTHPSRQS